MSFTVIIPPQIEAATRRKFSQPLLRWYTNRGRSLPWRETKDPYAIWLSEIMLQQTQVTTVLDYYHRFLEAFPTLSDLAEADLEAVLKLWQGLGYYARARNLQKAARIIVDKHSGLVPKDFEAILALPGIGRSTAGAILSIAYGQRHAILDGNVRRVLCRFFAIQSDPREKSIEAWLWESAETLLPLKKSDLFLQAIMDLGATLCLPKQPDCPSCPVKLHCEAFKLKLQHEIPLKAPKKTVPHFDYVAGIFMQKDQVLIRRRPLTGLLAGLWEFPNLRVSPNGPDETKDPNMNHRFRHFSGEILDGETKAFDTYMQIKHVFTHFKMTLHVFSCFVKNTKSSRESLRWVDKNALPDYPFSAAHQKIVVQILSTSTSPLRNI